MEVDAEKEAILRAIAIITKFCVAELTEVHLSGGADEAQRLQLKKHLPMSNDSSLERLLFVLGVSSSPFWFLFCCSPPAFPSGYFKGL